jgi:hypothetical protein
MTHFVFHEQGSIPGVPGTFAHCLVVIEGDGSLTVTPLVQQPHLVEVPGMADESTAEEGQASEAPPEPATLDAGNSSKPVPAIPAEEAATQDEQAEPDPVAEASTPEPTEGE